MCARHLRVGLYQLFEHDDDGGIKVSSSRERRREEEEEEEEENFDEKKKKAKAPELHISRSSTLCRRTRR